MKSDTNEHQPQFEDTKIDLRAVDRAISELRRGLPILISSNPGGFIIAVSAEQVTQTLLEALTELGGSEPTLAITSERAATLNLKTRGRSVTTLNISKRFDKLVIQTLADPTVDLSYPLRGPFEVLTTILPTPVTAAIEICKFAKLLPAAVISAIPNGNEERLNYLATEHNLIVVKDSQVLNYQSDASYALTKVASARIPLANAEDAEVIAYRPADGGIEHLAILIGQPSRRLPVLTRVHSECFTGDLLGSLRCDCGTQLHSAIEVIEKAGGGILIYLAQEGRGIGLINKLRAYELQDQGYDTFEANERLGFEADGRFFEPAVQILKLLGISRIRLLTNNPEKVKSVEISGIKVTERVPHSFPSNTHNMHYLAAKATKGGHHL